MSMYLALLEADRVELLTDGAVYDADGILRAVKTKVLTLPADRAAITSRGSSDKGNKLEKLVASMISRAGFDQAMENLAAILPEQSEAASADDFMHVELLIAAFSPTQGPTAFHFSTIAYDNIPAFQLRRVRIGIVNGNLMEEQHRQAIRAAGGFGAAVSLMEIGRRNKQPSLQFPDQAPKHSVGGHIDQTTVSAEGVSTRRIHVWADRIGHTIDPFANEANVFPMNRRQRRAAECQTKRSAL